MTASIAGVSPDVLAKCSAGHLAGGLGSWLGARANTLFGWTGVCAMVAVLAGLALARHLTPARP
jgi:hypothetical protein